MHISFSFCKRRPRPLALHHRPATLRLWGPKSRSNPVKPPVKPGQTPVKLRSNPPASSSIWYTHLKASSSLAMVVRTTRSREYLARLWGVAKFTVEIGKSKREVCGARVRRPFSAMRTCARSASLRQRLQAVVKDSPALGGLVGQQDGGAVGAENAVGHQHAAVAAGVPGMKLGGAHRFVHTCEWRAASSSGTCFTATAAAADSQPQGAH